jgi:hypothetical protein
MDWKGIWVIFHYNITQDGAVLISLKKIKEKCPNTWSYLLAFKERLKNREKGAWQTRKDWHAYSRKQNLHKFEQIKILTQVLAKKNSFALDRDGKYYFVGGGNAGGYGITLQKGLERKLDSDLTRSELYLFILGLLNSKLLEFYHKHVSALFSGKYYSYGRRFVEQMPIKLPKTAEEKKLAKQIIRIVETILKQVEPERLIGAFPDAYLDEYKLRGEEFDQIEFTFSKGHHKLEPVLSGQPDQGYVVYPGKDEDPVWVDTAEKAQYLILAISGRSVKQGEVLKVMIPKDNLTVTEIVERVKKTVQEIKIKRIDQLEEEIDELVYRLYGINKDDKDVIENFLKKF